MKKIMDSMVLFVIAISVLTGIVFLAEMKVYASAVKPLKTEKVNWVKNGEDLYKKEKYKEAIKAAEKAIQIKIYDADAYYLKGKAYGKLKNELEEKKNYGKAIILDPEKYYKKIMGLTKDEKKGIYYNALYDIELKVVEGYNYDDSIGQMVMKMRVEELDLKKIKNESDITKYINEDLAVCSVEGGEDIDESLVVLLMPRYNGKKIRSEKEIVDEICAKIPNKNYIEKLNIRDDIKVRGKSSYMIEIKLAISNFEYYLDYFLIPSETHIQGIAVTAYTAEKMEDYLEVISGLKK